MRIYDLTATISKDLPVYKNDPRVTISEAYEIKKGHACNVSSLSLGSHTGTHIDVPKHFFDDGLTCDDIPLDHFYGPCKVFDLRHYLNGRKSIMVSDLETLDIHAGDIVLLNTGNSPLMRDKVFHTDYVSLSPEAAVFLAEKNIKTLGVDYLSVEAYGSKGHDAHLALLGAGITIIEGLVFDNADASFFPQGTFTCLSALPLKIQNGNGSPVRAVVMDDRKVDLVIFDMDGLMLDTETVSVAGWHEAGRQLGYTYTPALFSRLFGCNREMCKQRMEEAFGLDFDFEKAYAIRTAYTQKYAETNGIAIKPGLLAMLDFLDERSIPKCVATSTVCERAVYCLERAGVGGRFDQVIGGDNVEHSKPEPDIFLAAAQAFGVNPRNCIVLEDSQAGAEAAYRAGMRTVLVPDLAEPDKVTMGRICALCKDLNEATEVIKLLL